MVGCSNDDDNNDEFANVTINEGPNGDIGGDFAGNGGDNSQTFEYQNALTTAEYNADITASSEGFFQMIIRDSDGNIVLDRALSGNEEPDSFSGVTDSGIAGEVLVLIDLKRFLKYYKVYNIDFNQITKKASKLNSNFEAFYT